MPFQIKLFKGFELAGGAGAGDFDETGFDADLSVYTPPGLFVQDTFTGTIGTLLPDHTPDIAPGGWVWSPFKAGGVNPVYELDGAGGLYAADAGDGNARGYVGDSEESDNIRIKFNVSPNAVNPNWCLIAYRKLDLTTDYNAGILIWFREGGNGTFALYAPGGALLDSGVLAAATNKAVRIEVELAGTLITGKAFNLTDETSLTISGNSAVQQSSTLHGLGARTAFTSQERFDDFVIEPL